MRKTPPPPPKRKTVDPKAAQALADWIVSGTTTPAKNIKVLWMGEHLSLIKYTYRNDSTAYLAPRYQQVRTLSPRGRTTEVWRCGRDEDGRVTKAVLARLLAETRQADTDFPAAEAARVEESRVKDERRMHAYAADDRVRKALGALLRAAKADPGDAVTAQRTTYANQLAAAATEYRLAVEARSEV